MYFLRPRILSRREVHDLRTLFRGTIGGISISAGDIGLTGGCVYHCEAEKKARSTPRPSRRAVDAGIIIPAMILANIDERAVRHRAPRRDLCDGNSRSNSASRARPADSTPRMLAQRQKQGVDQTFMRDCRQFQPVLLGIEETDVERGVVDHQGRIANESQEFRRP